MCVCAMYEQIIACLNWSLALVPCPFWTFEHVNGTVPTAYYSASYDLCILQNIILLKEYIICVSSFRWAKQ